MRRICFSALMAMTFLSCAPKSNPVSTEQPVSPSFVIVFGREVSPSGAFYYFEPFPYQDSVSVPYLDNLVQLGIRVTEYGLSDSLVNTDAYLDCSRALLKIWTRHDQETFQGSVNAIVRGRAASRNPGDPASNNIDFELLVPTSFDTVITQHNSILQMTGREDDLIIVQYKSLYTERVFTDTLVVTKY